MTPRATYRFQFHKGFGFADAERLLPYLDALGISHVYASPITVAAAGSMHGYDVVDPTRINPELGGEEAFRALATAAKARGMGIVIDIVPNHMGVAGGNAWWNDVLAKGQASEHAAVFDIDWRERIVLPVLGAPLSQVLADGDLTLSRDGGRWVLVAYGEHRFPIRDADQAAADRMPLAELLDRQHYRLASWRVANDELNWRRFFTVNDLAGVRIEDPAVFAKTHALYFRLHDEGLIDGVRVDHVDGLTDPIGYCQSLRARLGPDAWIVIEKILGVGEPQPVGWGVDGTSGYDFMEQVSTLLHDPAGALALAEAWDRISRRGEFFAVEEFEARQDMLSWQFAGQLDGCIAAFAALATSSAEGDGITRAMLRRAIERLLWVFPVYRTYGTGDAAPAQDARTRAIVRERVEGLIPPGEDAVTDLVLAWLAGDGPGDTALAAEAVRRFQQLSAPIAAKAVEDTAFYRYGRLISRNDVGADAETLGISLDAFHEAMHERARHVPHAMLTTATHDHKRGEDMRARLAVLSTDPATWVGHADRWMRLHADHEVVADDRYMLLQTLVGVWPVDGAADDLAERVKAWQQKALREGKLRSSWEAPDEAYEEEAAGLVDDLLADAAFVQELADYVAALAPAARANTIVQTLLRYTVPGVPDLYQGTELTDLSLVDPDNRRPVDYAMRERLLAEGMPAKMQLIADLLALRRADPTVFTDGDYRPVEVTGSDRIVAFERRAGGRTLKVAALIRGVDVPDATVQFADGERAAIVLFADRPIWFEIA
ncbi:MULTISPECIES: malto-oligosyltrehalose synthase [unclassified Sphingomonas]|jgi:(1->4)-alpha-D-glucan 1-alpha-D-glucosylmutase|uniref:malto-oligosyltrehalose synthase n=1 Tax=unclassified Sphingomonas TaxID=196159 RepID=UPI000E1018A6|nr:MULTISPECIES: malto-oligosyltrehalose synthase [unclassified Sphingomonas]AXJ95713.1 malto-oligosyltrehalose synthase [Sphingomonas sp. FARSPH]